MNNKIYLPGLNGIRAIAAFAVIISHLNNRLEYFGLQNSQLLDLASYGVTIFFTLSGFLITFLLLKEYEKTNTINIKKFYIRRVLRIWPLYYFYLVIVIVFNGFSTIQFPVLFYFLMIPNLKNSFVGIINTNIGTKIIAFMLGHYWSLGVEEQFYAFWPWVIKSTKKLLKFLVLLPVLFVLIKLFLRVFSAPYNVLVFVNYTRFGCLAIGGLGAYMFFNQNKIIVKCNKKWIEITAWIFFLVVGFNKFHITSIIDHEIISIFTIIIIYNQINNSKRLISLENKLFDYLGKISFGLYVYNPFIIYLVSLFFNLFAIQNKLLKLILIYSSVIIVLVLVAHISYNYFEKLFLKLKYNYTTIQSASSKSESNQ